MGCLGNSGDPEDSYASEKQRQSKLEKIEMEINRIMEKNNGQIFIVKHEKHNANKDGLRSDQFNSQDEVSLYGDPGYERLYRASYNYR